MRSALVALLLSACYAPKYPEGLSCVSPADPACPPGQQCVDEVCRATSAPIDAIVTGDGPPGTTDGTLAVDGRSIDALPCQITTWCIEPAGAGTLAAVWALPSGDAWAVGRTAAGGPLALRRVGGQWLDQMTGAMHPLTGVFGTPTHVVVVGEQGTVRKFDGMSWTDGSDPLIGATDLAAVWTVGTAIFTAGPNEYFTYSNLWHKYDVVAPALMAVFGRAANTVFLGGLGSEVFQGDGTGSLPIMNLPQSIEVRGVWASAVSAYFAGKDGKVERYDGNSNWVVELTDSTAGDLTAVSGTSDTDIYAVSSTGRVVHRGPGGWDMPQSITGGQLNGVMVLPNDVYAVGANATILHMPR